MFQIRQPQIALLKLTGSKQSQRYPYNVTRDKLLWIGILRGLQPPLPRTLRSRNLDNLSYPELEKAVSISHIAERGWMKQRDPSLTLPTGDKRYTIRSLHVLDDRWAVIIPGTGPHVIWDIQENPPKPYKLPEPVSSAFQDEAGGARAAIDPYQGDIIIGFWR